MALSIYLVSISNLEISEKDNIAIKCRKNKDSKELTYEADNLIFYTGILLQTCCTYPNDVLNKDKKH